MNKKIITEALTFDDVLLVPAYSEVLPYQVSLKTKLTKSIELHAPIISAAMDTVTEWRLAIAIAQQWWIWVIHKNMSIEAQAEQVKKVKRSENGIISDPVTISGDATIHDVQLIMEECSISGVPVLDTDQKLIGIITKRDLRFINNQDALVRDVMTKDGLITAPQGTTLDEAKKILRESKIEKLPLIDSKDKVTGLVTYKDLTNTTDHPHACKDSSGNLRVAAAVWVWWDVFDRVAALVEAGVDAIFVDTAHGHSAGVLKTVKEIKNTYPNTQIVGWNIATWEAALALADAGADAVKVWIWPWSICTTRIVAGIGYPQLSAVMNAATALQGTWIPVIADGGIRYSWDITKALAAWADCVMAGSLFAGIEEAPWETIIYQWRKYKSYRGMWSIWAMQKWSKDRYFQDKEKDAQKLVPEWIEWRVPYRWMLHEVMHQYMWGLRSGMWYCWAPDIPTLQQASFVKITAASMKESHPHDITITKEAPNYSQ